MGVRQFKSQKETDPWLELNAQKVYDNKNSPSLCTTSFISKRLDKHFRKTWLIDKFGFFCWLRDTYSDMCLDICPDICWPHLLLGQIPELVFCPESIGKTNDVRQCVLHNCLYPNVERHWQGLSVSDNTFKSNSLQIILYLYLNEN